MADCLVALGANIGDRRATLDAALASIDENPDTRVVARSTFVETPAIGGPAGQGAFFNAAARLETSLDCRAVWRLLVDVERRLGRVRDVRWGPRAIDLDLLLYSGEVHDADDLQIPHPRMAFRRFVLAPAAEIAADMRHPTIGWTIRELLEHLGRSPNYIALAGPIGVGKSHLAAQIAASEGWPLIHEPIVESRLARYYANPANAAWQTELEILDERAALLNAATWPATDDWTIGDFWFDQSLSFARRWLNDGQFLEFSHKWRSAAASVARPKLIVWLDAPLDVLVARITARGRECERRLEAKDVRELREALAEQIAAPGHGPVLRLNAVDIASAGDEIRAAAAAMR